MFGPGVSRDNAENSLDRNSTEGDNSKFAATKGLPWHGPMGTFEDFYTTAKETPVKRMSTKNLSLVEESRQESQREDSLNRQESRDSIQGKFFVKSKYHGGAKDFGKPRMVRAYTKGNSQRSKFQELSKLPNPMHRTSTTPMENFYPNSCTHTNEHTSEIHSVYSAKYGQNQTFSLAHQPQGVPMNTTALDMKKTTYELSYRPNNRSLDKLNTSSPILNRNLQTGRSQSFFSKNLMFQDCNNKSNKFYSTRNDSFENPTFFANAIYGKSKEFSVRQVRVQDKKKKIAQLFTNAKALERIQRESLQGITTVDDDSIAGQIRQEILANTHRLYCDDEPSEPSYNLGKKWESNESKRNLNLTRFQNEKGKFVAQGKNVDMPTQERVINQQIKRLHDKRSETFVVYENTGRAFYQNDLA